MTTELLPLLQTRLITRMGDHGKDLANTFAQFRASLRSCVVILLQTICDDALRVFQFSPLQYISTDQEVTFPLPRRRWTRCPPLLNPEPLPQ